MIHKIEGARNGYFLDDTSTNEEWKKIVDGYGKSFHCLICNVKTTRRFKRSFLGFGNNGLTINNHLKEDEVYINGIY